MDMDINMDIYVDIDKDIHIDLDIDIVIDMDMVAIPSKCTPQVLLSASLCFGAVPGPRPGEAAPRGGERPAPNSTRGGGPHAAYTPES